MDLQLFLNPKTLALHKLMLTITATEVIVEDNHYGEVYSYESVKDAADNFFGDRSVRFLSQFIPKGE